MAVTVQRQCASAVTAMSQDALVGSAMANGTTLILVALRPHACQAAWGTQARRCRRPTLSRGRPWRRATRQSRSGLSWRTVPP